MRYAVSLTSPAHRRLLLRLPVGLLAGFAAIVSLATLWHLVGFVNPPIHEGHRSAHTPGYEFTEYFTHCISGSFVAAYAVVSLALGWKFQSGGPAALWSVETPAAASIETIPVALGMVLPLPIALLIEVIRDPTSHNLFPFEVLLYWLPAFLVAWGGAACGWLIRARSRTGQPR